MGWQILLMFLELYKWVLIVRVLASWFVGPGSRNALMDTLEAATDPVLRPLSAVIPPMGGLDLTPLVAIFGIHFVQRLIASAAMY
jgi:YggT family protein